MHLRSTLLLLATSISASLAAPRLAHEPVKAVTAELTGAGAVSAIGSATAKLASAGTRNHVGFDTNVYPGDKAMDAWKRTGEYEWVGYYLEAPCHSDTTWSGKRAQLV